MGGFRSLTKKELEEVIPEVSKGWETQRKEFDFEFSNDQIEGAIPLGLRGTFIRNGPGVNDVFGVPLAHPIDGDGLVVQLAFEDGKARLKSAFVQTFSHVNETKAGKMLYPGQMGSKVPNSKEKQYRDPSHTNVFSWGSKLVAAHEFSLPNSLDPVTMQTLGRDSFDGALEKLRTMCAHYRYDQDLDLLAVASFKAGAPFANKAPQLEIFEFDRAWKIARKTEINVPGLNYVHDFLLTPTHYIFHVTPFVDVGEENIKEILAGRSSPGQQMRYYPHLPSQMVVIDRVLNKSHVKQPKFVALDVPPCHIYHFGWCREARDGRGNMTIRFNACCLPPGFTMEWQHKAFLSNSVDAPGLMHEFFVTLGDSPSCTRSVVETTRLNACEFPTTHPYRHCLREKDGNVTSKFAYLMAGQKGVPLPFNCVIKHDAISNHSIQWNAEGVVGEPCFIPRLGYASAKYGEEDDGWVVVQHFLYKEKRVEFVILDAKDLSVLARLKLPDRIPYGFHGTFTPDIFLHPKPSPAIASKL